MIYRTIKSTLIPFLRKDFVQNKLFIFWGLGLLFFFTFSTGSISRGLDDLHIIDLTKIPEKENPVYLSQFASEITYLPLETKKVSMIGPGVKFYLFDSIIVSRAHHQILTFDSKNGEFIRSIGEYGRGPNGFMNSKSAYLKNGEITISALGWNYYLIEYSANGEILTKLNFEKRPRDIAWLSGNSYAVYFKKQTDFDTLRVIIYDSAMDKIISAFYDTRKFPYIPQRTTNYGAFFYYFNNELSIKEYFNDTVFRITTNKLIPGFVFKSGKYSPPFFEKHSFDYTQYHIIRYILETEHLIFFQLYFKKRGYFCYYDKRTNQVTIPNYRNLQINGFENDIDGFMPFHPISLSNRKELIGFLEPYKIRQWIAENPDKAAKLPLHLQKFKNIKETDNPVVMIAKLKD